MESLSPYIPTDRLLALARGVDLPDRTTGAGLFADISGFTPLTEELVQTLGPQRGAEELSRWLNTIYSALIAEVDNYRGSVINFAGDAITCWFDDRDVENRETQLAAAALRATACALSMQKAMRQFAQVEVPGGGTIPLAIKVAVSTGPARRFIVGDPTIQLIDILAGKTLYRLAAGEHHAEKGEVVLDEATTSALGEKVNVVEWRDDNESGARFAIIGKLNAAPAIDPWPILPSDTLSNEQIRPWLLPPVYERLKGGMGEFLTELRPAAALFLRFEGIDYDDDDEAQAKLDAYVRAAQYILKRYDNYVIQITIGDKGSYFYASFGALLAYEDDSVRAVSAARELRDLQMDFITNVQIGVSQGRARTGAYGGLTRRTYGALGDEVNMAARLMQSAGHGQVLINQNVQKAAADSFTWEELPPLLVKGKSQPVTAFRLIAEKERRFNQLQEAKYALPMVGRNEQLALIDKKIMTALQGRGQILGVSAEAGMGKSRLIAEGIRLARQSNMTGYGNECQSYGTNTSYLVWQSIWRGFFELDSAWPVEKQIRELSRQLKWINPDLLPRLPLLGAALNLQIPDNDLTSSFDAKLRKESLESLLVDCLRQRARRTPVLLVLEDCHWLDPLSQDLLATLGRAIADIPVLIMLTYRPEQVGKQVAVNFSSLGYFTEIPLGSLPLEDITQLVSLKLAQTYGEHVQLLPALVEQIAARAEGNPFYVEELLNYLRDREIDPQQPDALQKIELPNSLYSLILSRVDQLSENQKTLLKVASVIGRLFQVAMVWGIYNQLGDQEHLHHELDLLSNLDLTQLAVPEPELTYFFKHILTQEVSYETLPFATRAMLHEQIGQYIENTRGDMLDRYIDLLAYHYDRSDNLPKKRKYLLKAGEVAQSEYANAVAISYYERVLQLLPEDQQIAVMLKLGQVLELVGEWQKAEEINRQAEALAARLNDSLNYAQVQRALGLLLRKRGEYTQSQEWMERARENFRQLKDIAGFSYVLADIGEIHRLQGKYVEARAYYDQSLRLADDISDPQVRQKARAHALKGAGTVATWQGDYATARILNEESLTIRREIGDIPGVATLLNNLGIIARFQNDLSTARQMNEASIALFRKLGDRWAVGTLLNNQACVASDQKEYAVARTLLEESLFICRQLGDKGGVAFSLNTMADVVLDEGDYPAARPLLDESLVINRELGDQTAIAYLIEDYGGLAAAEQRYTTALQLAGFAFALRETIGAPLPSAEQVRVDRMIAPARAALSEDEAKAAWDMGRALTLDQAVELALNSK